MTQSSLDEASASDTLEEQARTCLGAELKPRSGRNKNSPFLLYLNAVVLGFVSRFWGRVCGMGPNN